MEVSPVISASDKEKILEELGGLPAEIYDSLVAEHLALVKDKMRELNDLLEQGNYDEFRKLSHYLKSSSANLRLVHFQDLGTMMENASEGSIDRDTLVQSMEKLEKLIANAEMEGLL